MVQILEELLKLYVVEVLKEIVYFPVFETVCLSEVRK